MTPAPTCQIRDSRFTHEEAVAVAGIWRRAWSAARHDAMVVEPIGHWLGRVKAEFEPPSELLLVEREKQVLGFMVLHTAHRYVAQLYVDRHVQGQGLGRMLLDEASRRMPEGWKLHVALDNVKAQHFYAHCGLTPGAIDRHPGTGVPRVAYHCVPGER
ncbi:GNAT family N-acetyltransferase [Variovorax robiniae]|uniref:GNAT family N-acetyltransferase n=1 Tax=Variovorax robiniae TaxID=1836199 RepID=A0ABU8X2M1_9BURK